MDQQNQIFELGVLSEYGAKEKIISKNATASDIIHTMSAIDWNFFHQVILSKSDHEWLEVGGNLTEDGLACVFEENEEIFVIDEPPTTVKQMTDILLSYFYGDGKFRNEHSFNGDIKKSIPKQVSTEKFERWKKDYAIQEKKEKATGYKRIMVAVIAILFISTTGYYWYTGELKFLGQKTEFTKATVTNIRLNHYGKGYYHQIVTFEFEYEDQKYTGTFKAGKREGIQKLGDFIKVKFSISNPNRSVIVGFYRK